MNQWAEDEWDAFRIVDDSLRAIELEEVPPNFTVSVMERVGVLSPLPYFRLKWIDLFLGGFAAAMLGIVILVGLTLPPYFDLTIRQEMAYWFHRVLLDPAPWILWFAAALMGVMGGVFGMALLYRTLAHQSGNS